MGEIAPIGDPVGLAEAINKVLDNGQRYICPPQAIADSFAPQSTAQEYIHLFNDLLQGKDLPSALDPPAYNRLRQLKESA
jgi:hypothetical protein